MNCSKGWRIEPHDPTTIISKNGDTIALCDSPYRDQKSIPVEQRLANARLIVKSPKMYEALKFAQAFITEGTKPQREKALSIITEALPKTEGK